MHYKIIVLLTCTVDIGICFGGLVTHIRGTCQTSVKRIESIQKRFLLFTLRHLFPINDFHNLPPYSHRLQLIDLQILSARRKFKLSHIAQQNPLKPFEQSKYYWFKKSQANRLDTLWWNENSPKFSIGNDSNKIEINLFSAFL